MAKLLIICALLSFALVRTGEAIVFRVGDSAGWDISTDLPSWVTGKVFYVGDVLLFQYSKYHSLNEVDKAGYDNCNATNPIIGHTDGNTSVPLTTSGDKYFICGILTHCLGGMKLQVTAQNRPRIAPAGAPQSPAVYAAAAPSPLFQRPAARNDNPASPTLLSGSFRVATGNTFGAWLCTFGALLWFFLRV